MLGVVVIVNKDIDYLENALFGLSVFKLNGWWLENFMLREKKNRLPPTGECEWYGSNVLYFVKVQTSPTWMDCNLHLTWSVWAYHGELAPCTEGLGLRWCFEMKKHLSKSCLPPSPTSAHTQTNTQCAPGVSACNPSSHKHLQPGVLSLYVSPLNQPVWGLVGRSLRQHAEAPY